MKSIIALIICLAFTGCAGKLAIAPVIPSPIARNTGQLDGTCSMQAETTTKRLVGRRMAADLTVWVCGFTNNSPSAVGLTDAAVIRTLAHLHPVGRAAVDLLVADGDKHSPSAIAGRILMGTTAGVNVAAATKSLSIPQSLATSLAFLISYGPTAVNWFKGVEVPVSQSVATMMPPVVMQLQPGGSGSMYIFTEKWQWTPVPQEFSISVTNLPSVKIAQ